MAYVSTFGVGKGVAKVLAFLGWGMLVAGLGLLVFSGVQLVQTSSGPGQANPFGGLVAGASLYGVGAALGLVLAGLAQIAGGQAIRALLETSEHTGEVLELLRDHARRQAAEEEARRRAAAAPRPEPETVCLQCKTRFPGDLKGQFCEKCGAPL